MRAQLRAFVASLLVAVLFLVVSVSRNGIWDPYELDRSDLARRVAIHRFGADSLALPGSVNTLPTLGDLAMGELPFTSMAAGFATFGLNEWAGRLPLALWALLGTLVLSVFLTRLVSARAGLYGAIALCTMPLYFLQARTMLGDVVTMAALTCAVCGLAAAWLDARTDFAIAWLGVGLFGLVSGFLCRGALVGVAVPCLGVGVSWLVVVAAGGASRAGGLSTRWRPRLVGALSFGVGLYAMIKGVEALELALAESGKSSGVVTRMMGTDVLARSPREATFDVTLRDLAHALFPWSAFLPFAVGRMFDLPRRLADRPREVSLRVVLLVCGAVCFGAHAWLAPRTGPIPFSGPGLLAAIAALAIVDFERGAPPSGAVGAGTAVVALLLFIDFTKIPTAALAPYGVEATLPHGFIMAASWTMVAATIAFTVVIALGWLQRNEHGPALGTWLAGRRAKYSEVWDAVRGAWNGNLLFGFLLLEAASVGIGITLLLGRQFGWQRVTTLPQFWAKVGLNVWWALPLTIVAVPLAIDAARGVFALLLGWVKLPRAATTALAALIAGAFLCFGYYPVLAAQLSPKEVFETYQRLRQPGDRVAVLGVRDRSARFYAGGADVTALGGARAAYDFLADGSDERRWLVFRSVHLAELNALYRERAGRNLPVLDARSQAIMLASNELWNQPDENPLSPFLLQRPPDHIQHPVDGQFEDKLKALGWDIVDEEGALVAYVVPGRTYRTRFYYRVLRPLRKKWKAFLHIDGYGRRQTGDHDVMGGRYPTTHWRSGDVIIDEHVLELQPNILPGKYLVLYGFFSSGDNRLKITRGNHHKNRLKGGTLEVR